MQIKLVVVDPDQDHDSGPDRGQEAEEKKDREDSEVKQDCNFLFKASGADLGVVRVVRSNFLN